MARLELPDDVLVLIREYAQPVTRPDWRTLHKMTKQQYQNEYYMQYVKRRIVLYSCIHSRNEAQYNTIESTYMLMFNKWNFEHTFGIPKIDWYINS